MKRVSILLIVLFMLVFSGCASFNESLSKLYDDDSKIAKSDSYSSTGSVSSSTDAKVTFSAKSFFGVKSLKNNYSYDGVSIDAVVTVGGGEFKLVLVGSDGSVHLIAEGTCSGITSVAAPAGKYTIKAVGRDAKDISVTIKL